MQTEEQAQSAAYSCVLSEAENYMNDLYDAESFEPEGDEDYEC